MSDEGIGFIACMFLLGVIIFGGMLFSNYQCHAQWASYGKTSWGPVQKCMVEYKGKWTPATSIREF